jgi:mono/diheme cytochrome c family protein
MKNDRTPAKMGILKRNYLILALAAASAGLYSFTYLPGKPWVVPDAAAKKANPVKSNAESIKTGKDLFIKHCASCHGKTGKGDGTKAAQLETSMEDFSSDAVQGQSDGSLFYKTQIGRDEMPSFKKKITDEDEIWSVVNFMRTLKK